MMIAAWPKTIDCGHDWVTFRNAHKAGLSKGKIRARFRPGTEPVENVAGGPVRPRLHQ